MKQNLFPFSLRMNFVMNFVMNPVKHITRGCGLLICLCVSTLLLTLPAYAELPTRPPTNSADAPPLSTKGDAGRAVAPLVLTTNLTQSGLWSVVQWQDAQGNWQDVTSWRGTLAAGSITWWVEEKDFGKGPFRWLILQGEGGAVVAMSQPFRLPTQVRKAMTIEVKVQ